MMPITFVLRVIAAVVLAMVILFCSFGFLASYEYQELSRRLPWQIGYTVIGLLCLGGIFLLIKPRPKRRSGP